ncbi:uncharacterized protein LOC108874599 [Lates japonicus]
MSATPGQMMMAWVWVCLVTLARLNTAEDPHRDADEGLAALQALFSASEPPGESGSGGGFFPVPVWKFVKEPGDGAEPSDFGQPQFRCSDRSLSVRFSLIRHSDLRLQDGRRLLSLPDRCHGSVRTFGPWLLLKLPYTSCHMSLWVSNGTWFHQLKLHYFDHLLQAKVTGVASCENPATLLHLEPPLVTCRMADVMVKLPPGSRLMRVKALGKDGVAGRALTAETSGTVLVQIPGPVDMDSIFEIIYVDSVGELSTILAACLKAKTRSGQVPHPRAREEPDLWELWDFEEIPLEPYSPGPTETPATTEPTAATESTATTETMDAPTTVTTVSTPVTWVTYADADIFELWGFGEIPSGPYTGDTIATTTPTTPTTSSTTSSATSVDVTTMSTTTTTSGITR